jgi:hypothetical protein
MQTVNEFSIIDDGIENTCSQIIPQLEEDISVTPQSIRIQDVEQIEKKTFTESGYFLLCCFDVSSNELIQKRLTWFHQKMKL